MRITYAAAEIKLRGSCAASVKLKVTSHTWKVKAPRLEMGEHWTGSPNKSIDQVPFAPENYRTEKLFSGII